MEVTIYTDGGARGNPGPAAIGVVILGEDCQVLEKFGKFVADKATNNQAEYQAVLEALKAVQKHQPSKLTFFSDSQLMVEQLNGRYKIKNQNLKKYAERILLLKQKLACSVVEFRHVPREKNKEADRLVNYVLDEHAGQNSKIE